MKSVYDLPGSQLVHYLKGGYFSQLPAPSLQVICPVVKSPLVVVNFVACLWVFSVTATFC